MRGERFWTGGGEKREEEGRGRKGKKGTQPVDDVNTPVSESILKAVVASQDLGAAGTEFERSLIVSPFNNFLPFFNPSFLSSFNVNPLDSLGISFPPIFYNFFSSFLGRQGSNFVRFVLRPMLFQIGVFWWHA
jgi:hypothetical protein